VNRSSRRCYAFARQTASPRTMIGTSTSHAAASIIIDGASLRGPSRATSRTTSIDAWHGGMLVVKRTAAPFKQPVLRNPLARVSLGCEAGCRPDHRTELAQGDTVTAVVADEDVIDWLRHALHMARHRAKYMARLHKLSCSTEIWSHGQRVRQDRRGKQSQPAQSSGYRASRSRASRSRASRR
jgi:hypothetical protein